MATATPKRAKPTKDESIRLRCTKQQKDRLEKTAQKRGLSLSSWLLALGIEAAELAEKGAKS